LLRRKWAGALDEMLTTMIFPLKNIIRKICQQWFLPYFCTPKNKDNTLDVGMIP
jgi:hypothetical protein